MKQIREVIVVEGKHDTAALKRYFACSTIETGGSAINEEVLQRIAEAQRTTGVIVFTDPDAPGKKIRDTINQRIPGCKNAYVLKEDARTSRKVGIEHAGREVLTEALNHLVTWQDRPAGTITAADFYRLGLCGKADSRARRAVIGRRYQIGYGNARALRQRLNQLGLTPRQLQEVLEHAG